MMTKEDSFAKSSALETMIKTGDFEKLKELHNGAPLLVQQDGQWLEIPLSAIIDTLLSFDSTCLVLSGIDELEEGIEGYCVMQKKEKEFVFGFQVYKPVTKYLEGKPPAELWQKCLDEGWNHHSSPIRLQLGFIKPAALDSEEETQAAFFRLSVIKEEIPKSLLQQHENQVRKKDAAK